MKRSLSLAASLLAAVAAVPAQAAAFADPAQIESEVAAFVGVSPAEVPGTLIPIDRRLRLTACARPLDLSWNGNRQDSVLVQCPQPGGWKLYVRLANQSQSAARAQPAPAAVKRGEAVTVSLKGRGFTITQAAQSLDDGAVGEWVRIRVGKDSELQAQVLRPGAVGMSLQ